MVLVSGLSRIFGYAWCCVAYLLRSRALICALFEIINWKAIRSKYVWRATSRCPRQYDFSRFCPHIWSSRSACCLLALVPNSLHTVNVLNIRSFTFNEMCVRSAILNLTTCFRNLQTPQIIAHMSWWCKVGSQRRVTKWKHAFWIIVNELYFLWFSWFWCMHRFRMH